jgi:glycosyltransferase involved in cell wall biosynthesis
MIKRTIRTAYVPHGINPKYYYPITEGDKYYEEYSKFESEFKSKNKASFVVFWNNRNIRRKQPGDVILSYRRFCDKLDPKDAQGCVLFMHTEPRDENGTDLVAVKNEICKDYKVVFSDRKVGAKELNFFYNLADVTLNIASNEGFGLSAAESIMCGTPIINNVTGGLQDQCRFEDGSGEWVNFNHIFTSNHTAEYKKHGVWAKPVFPTNRSLQGSLPTPYIFDDRCSFEDVADAIHYWYSQTREQRKSAGMKGREWAMSEESGMSSNVMCDRFIKHINHLLDVWKPEDSFNVYKFEIIKENPSKNIGITW